MGLTRPPVIPATRPPEIELLQLKQVIVMHHFSDEEVLAGDFPQQAVIACRAMKPFLDYLNDALA